MIAELRITVTEAYWVGAAVTIFSFIRHNPWFDGKVAVYTLPDQCESMARSFSSVSGVCVRPVSDRLLSSINTAIEQNEYWVEERFLSLQMLADESDEDVLFVDADLLFMRSVSDLNISAGHVSACHDGAAYRDSRVHRITNEEMQSENAADPRELVNTTFNSGLMGVPAQMLGNDLFERALGFVNSDTLGKVTRRHHDQFVLNRLFESQWKPLEATYNYLLAHPDLIFRKTGLRLSDAHVLHFNTRPRPWDLVNAAREADPRLAHAIALWLNCYGDMMKTQSLKRAKPQSW